MNILPSSHRWLPTGLEKASYALTNHSPSQPEVRVASVIFSISLSISAFSSSKPKWESISTYCFAYFTNKPAMNTDSAFPLSKFEQVWKLSPGVEEKQFRLRQSFQSALPIRGRPWGPLWETVYPIHLLRCSKRLFALVSSLLKGTCSSRIDQSPVSERYEYVQATSHNGSSLKPPPISAFPFLSNG